MRKAPRWEPQPRDYSAIRHWEEALELIPRLVDLDTLMKRIEPMKPAKNTFANKSCRER